jgi:hypothetical protein
MVGSKDNSEASKTASAKVLAAIKGSRTAKLQKSLLG